jgi:hypothetical protein
MSDVALTWLYSAERAPRYRSGGRARPGPRALPELSTAGMHAP